MQKELISTKQAVCMIVLYIIGSSVVMGGSSEAGQDSWISSLLALAIVIPLLLIYARLIKLYPGMDLYDMAEELFGKVVGKIIIILMVWYSLHLGSLVLRNFSEFIEIVSLPETPQLPIMIFMLAVTIYLARSGVETLGKWSVIILPIVLFIVSFTIIFSLQLMDFKNLLPVMGHSFGEVGSASFKLFTFPYAETILFVGLASAVKKEDSPYKIYLYASLIGALVITSVIIRNNLLLGPALVKAEYFPSYVAARLISIGDFITRIEGSISVNFILAGTTKITVCLLASAKGLSKLFGIQTFRKMVVPAALFMLALGMIIYEDTMQMFAFIDIYQFYALPFQILIPIALWIGAEIKMHRGKNEPAAQPQ